MKAEIAHISLNPRGGAERLSVAVMTAMSEMGFNVHLRTFERPDPEIMIEAYSAPLSEITSTVGSLNLVSGLFHPERKSGCEITINTHGDLLPFYRNAFSKSTSIVYCHFPIAPYLIESDDKNYSDLLVNAGSSKILPDTRDHLLDIAKIAYRNMIVSSTVLTNSEYSRKAIFKTFGVDSAVIYPPVETHFFQKLAISKSERSEDILVLSRFHRSKKIENAIRIAKLLSKRSVGRRMIIAGNVSPDGIAYYESLRKLVKDYELDGFVRFAPNASYATLLEMMRDSKVYLHPLPGEPFGISTVESMSAGLIPVVPDIGGHTEFVPQRYQFHTFGEAADVIVAALDASISERAWMSHRAAAFSVPNFITRFKETVADVMRLARSPVRAATPLPATQKLTAERPSYSETA